MNNRGRRAALLAWHEALADRAKEFEEAFVVDEKGEICRYVYDDTERTEKVLLAYGHSRIGLMKLLEAVERQEAARDRQNEKWQRNLACAAYNSRVRGGFLSSRDWRTNRFKHERERFTLERRQVKQRLYQLQEILVRLDGIVVMSPKKVAYLSSAPLSADSETVFFRDHLGVDRLVKQIARDERRERMMRDLELIDPEEPSESSEEVRRIVRVSNSEEMLAVIQSGRWWLEHFPEIEAGVFDVANNEALALA